MFRWQLNAFDSHDISSEKSLKQLVQITAMYSLSAWNLFINVWLAV